MALLLKIASYLLSATGVFSSVVDWFAGKRIDKQEQAIADAPETRSELEQDLKNGDL